MGDFDPEHLLATTACFSRYYTATDDGRVIERPLHWWGQWPRSPFEGVPRARQVADVLSTAPTRTLRVLTAAPERLNGDAWNAFAGVLHLWLGTPVASGGVDSAERLAAVDRLAVFGDLLQGVAAADGRILSGFDYDAIGSAVRDATTIAAAHRAELGAAAQIFTDRRGLFTELDEDSLRLARAQVLAVRMLTQPWWPDGWAATERLNCLPETVRVLARHIDDPARIAAAVYSRRSLDPALLQSILEPVTPALVEGTL